MVELTEHSESFGQAWHVPCAPTPTQRELLTLIFEEAGKQPKLGQTPSLVFKGVGLFVPIMRELAEMLYQWERPYHFNHDKFERAFGKQPVTSHRDAVRETVKWFRENPKKA